MNVPLSTTSLLIYLPSNFHGVTWFGVENRYNLRRYLVDGKIKEVVVKVTHDKEPPSHFFDWWVDLRT
jgi:hypothetical protein